MFTRKPVVSKGKFEVLISMSLIEETIFQGQTKADSTILRLIRRSFDKGKSWTSIAYEVCFLEESRILEMDRLFAKNVPMAEYVEVLKAMKLPKGIELPLL